jgi:hypothetical protein
MHMHDVNKDKVMSAHTIIAKICRLSGCVVRAHCVKCDHLSACWKSS